MISRLFIQQFILIEQADIRFDEGLQILTGETGAGKSIVLSAIRLLLGAKSEIEYIRPGAPLAIIEAELKVSSLLDWLKEKEISIFSTDTITLRREIHRSGRSRCFIEDQQISLSLLKEITSQTVELVDQHSACSLCNSANQRKWLDTFGGFSPLVHSFNLSFAEEKKLEATLNKLLDEQKLADLQQQRAQEDLTLIEQANYEEQEEDRLTEEHNILTNMQQLQCAAGSTLELLSDGQKPILPLLKKASHTLEQMLTVDGRLKESASSLKRAALELEEANFSLRSYVDQLDADPRRLEVVEERLALLEKLKKRFGSLNGLRSTQDELQKKISHLDQLDTKIAEILTSLQAIQENNRQQAKAISQLRKDASLKFAQAVSKELISLNLPHARFELFISSTPISLQGIDDVSFLFSANPGYLPLPLEECASGGELSRVFLAIKTVLAERDPNTCLIFDEIDSNVGGQTATILGEKLQALAEKRQIICITHFAQVARFGTQHFLVAKKDSLTTVKQLNLVEREQEFHRMLGKIDDTHFTKTLYQANI